MYVLNDKLVGDSTLAHRLLVAIPNVLLNLFRYFSQHIFDNLQSSVLGF
jgi:hypothetical protein